MKKTIFLMAFFIVANSFAADDSYEISVHEKSKENKLLNDNNKMKNSMLTLHCTNIKGKKYLGSIKEIDPVTITINTDKGEYYKFGHSKVWTKMARITPSQYSFVLLKGKKYNSMRMEVINRNTGSYIKHLSYPDYISYDYVGQCKKIETRIPPTSSSVLF